MASQKKGSTTAESQIAAHIGPDTPLERLVGGPTAQKLQKGLGLTSAKELMDHFPRRYLNFGQLASFQELQEGEAVSFLAQVVSRRRREMRRRRGIIVEVEVKDDDGMLLNMAFFAGYQAHRDLAPGVTGVFHGKVSSYRGRLTLNNPVYEVVIEADDKAVKSHIEDVKSQMERPYVLYPATSSVASFTIRRCIRLVMDAVDLETWPDPIPEHIRTAENLPGLAESYRRVHSPAHPGAEDLGWRRFRMEEAVVLQGLLHHRRRHAAASEAYSAPRREEGALSAFDAQLPFDLTQGQRESGELLAEELSANQPMNRLLQGEVGSGKTLVALRAMLQVVDAGAQAALIAPTEVLATQHLRSVKRALGKLADTTKTGLLAEAGAPDPVQITLLTGSMSTAERRQALLDIASGKAQIIVGTHAVLSETVQFAQLGLVVVDEQHRFGVAQRNALRERYQPSPHMLVMSATPIPRSVAMTVFGDLELTVLRGLPGGRSPIQTHLVPTVRGPHWIERVWQRVAEQALQGHQVYVVCPKITTAERSEEEASRQLQFRFGFDSSAQETTMQLQTAEGGSRSETVSRQWAEAFIAQDASVDLITEKLAENAALEGVRIGAVHGRLPTEELAATMGRFESGELDVLVSTTVVEVGVDVPNASTMVILDAESFGISTLHQLRGRIGRGQTANNLCLLVTRMPEDHPSVNRLRDVAEHSDGMELARLDLQRRREGDVLGAAQAGKNSSLKLLRIIRDEELITRAAEHIATLSEQDPDWESAPGLARAVESFASDHDDAADYAEQG